MTHYTHDMAMTPMTYHTHTHTAKEEALTQQRKNWEETKKIWEEKEKNLSEKFEKKESFEKRKEEENERVEKMRETDEQRWKKRKRKYSKTFELPCTTIFSCAL